MLQPCILIVFTESGIEIGLVHILHTMSIFASAIICDPKHGSVHLKFYYRGNPSELPSVLHYCSELVVFWYYLTNKPKNHISYWFTSQSRVGYHYLFETEGKARG